MENEKQTLLDFFETIYGNQEGLVYVATKPANKVQQGAWNQHWFKWPDQHEKIVDRVLFLRERNDVYYGPALYSKRVATKENVIGSQFCWVDFDGNAPEFDLVSPKPTIVLQSSESNNQHWYWKSEVFIDDISLLERFNFNLAAEFNADASGWDCTQVLRPPCTTNYKRGTPTKIIFSGDSVLNHSESELFRRDVPQQVEAEQLGNLPKVADILNKYKLPAVTHVLFTKGARVGKRSIGLAALAYQLCEIGLSNEEAFSLLIDADNRWGKFSERKDQEKQLLAILSVGRQKFPLPEGSENPIQEDTSRLQVIGFSTLLTRKEIEIKWLWDGFLQEEGFLLLTGAPKVGKTQFSLDFGISAILGENFLDRKVHGEPKIGFLSLEMNAPELKLFMTAQAQSLNEDQMKTLDERFLMIPMGEPYYLNREANQNDLEELIAEHKLTGLMVDSFGAATEGELTSEKNVKAVMDWNDQIRRRHGCFTWFIHHHRKSNGDNKKPNKLDDIYGSYLFSARVTTALTLWSTGSTNTINLIPNAVRLAETPAAFPIYRDSKLRFTTHRSGLTIKTKSGKVLDAPGLEEIKEEEISDEEFVGGKTFRY